MAIMKDEVEGNRKVVLTKWMLTILTFITVGYLLLMGYRGWKLPDSFFMNFVMGLGAIGGAFTAGNIFEHRAKSQEVIEEKRTEAGKSTLERTKAETERANAEAAKSKADTDKAKAETEKSKADAEKARAEAEKEKVTPGRG